MMSESGAPVRVVPMIDAQHELATVKFSQRLRKNSHADRVLTRAQ
jgi:hypothetical protein